MTIGIQQKINTNKEPNGIDKIVFENLSNEDLIFTQKDNNLVIHYSINDSVTILNYFDNTTSNYLEKIAFKNDLETIDASNIITGTINDDEINGTYFDESVKKEDISFIIKDNNLLNTIFESEKSVA